MLIINKYPYKPLERVDTPEGRRYIVGETRPLPSVTTILSSTKDQTHLNEWKKNVGEDQAKKIAAEASSLGSGMHSNLENYIFGKPMTGSFMAKSLANLIVQKGLSKVNEIWGSEVSLYSKDLYAGTTDLLGVHEQKPSIIDFKNSLQKKEKEWIEDYFLQLTAYALAHNEMFGTDIRRGVLMIATRDVKYQEFIIEGSEFDHYTGRWCNRLEEYYNKYGHDK